jgi:hypothetical protein
MTLVDILKFCGAALVGAFLAGAAVNAQSEAISANKAAIDSTNRRVDVLEPRVESINDVREDVAYMKGRVDSIAERLGVPKDNQ